MSAHFDVVVVGSGFGGSVVAARLAEAGRRVCVLERGQAFPPGSFPRTQHGVSRNVWDPSEGRFGMFNVWSFRGIEALVSAGLGGGSLIYANVLLRKPREWFVEDHTGVREPWPVTYDDLQPHYDEVERRMNAQRYPFDKAPYNETRKTRALQQAAARLGVEWELPPLAVTFWNEGEEPVPGEPIREARPNLHGRTRTTCWLCGECDVGCNTGSKNTLDYTYLSDAAHAGAEIRTLSEVRRFEPRPEGGYRIHYVHHDPDGTYWRDAGHEPVEVTSDRLVLSAGTFGSTFLLLKNRPALGALSPRLGERFCGNGDLLSFAMKCVDEEGGETRDLGPTYGPVITSTVRIPDALDGRGTGRGYLVQDAGFPAFVTWLLEASNVKGTARRLVRAAVRRVRARLGRDPRSDISAEIADALGECDLSRGSLPLLGMGRDVPDGTLSLAADGHLACDWSIRTSKPYFDTVIGTMRDISDAWGGKFVPNPTYRMSRVITVHPLGGCPMGTDPEAGVVDPYGEVFGHAGLYVADGSVMPGPTGPNPALTIAALADRTADRILAQT